MQNDARTIKIGYLIQTSIGTGSANSLELDLGCTSRVYLDNVTLTSKKPCQHNNQFDCSETNGYNIPQDAINEL